jgi:hypothetical protein
LRTKKNCLGLEQQSLGLGLERRSLGLDLGLDKKVLVTAQRYSTGQTLTIMALN